MLHQFGRQSFVLLEPDEVAQPSQIHLGKLGKPTCKRTFYLPALHFQNNKAKINDAGDMAAFMALWDTPVKDGEPTGNPPINDWPDVVE